MAAEENLCEFEKIFHYEISINDFRDYVENVLKNFDNHTIPPTIQKAKNNINTIAVSSAEAERGFSVMNIICSDKSCLTVSNVSNLMTIILTGLPFESWDPTQSVKTWLRRHQYC